MPSSTYISDALLDATINGGTFPTVATSYLALYSVAPGPGGGGTQLTGSNYSRINVAYTVTTGVASNTSAVSFPTATGNWVTAVAWGIFDAATGGNLLYYGSLAPAQTVMNGNTMTFDAGNISITVD